MDEFDEIKEVLRLNLMFRKLYPYGHPKFIHLCSDEIKLHSQKNYDYAHGGHPLGNFYRRAAIYRLYPDLDLGDASVVAMVDLMKQLDAALWLKSQKIEAKVENVQKRLMDVSVYAKIIALIEDDYAASCGPTPPVKAGTPGPEPEPLEPEETDVTWAEIEDRLKTGL